MNPFTVLLTVVDDPMDQLLGNVVFHMVGVRQVATGFFNDSESTSSPALGSTLSFSLHPYLSLFSLFLYLFLYFLSDLSLYLFAYVSLCPSLPRSIITMIASSTRASHFTLLHVHHPWPILQYTSPLNSCPSWHTLHPYEGHNLHTEKAVIAT